METCESILEICKKKTFGPKDITKIFLFVDDLINHLIHLAELNKNLPHTSNVAYGFVHNPYSTIIWRLNSCVKNLENYFPKREKILEISLLDDSHVFNDEFFYINYIKDLANQVKELLKLLEKAYENQKEIQALSLRYDENDEFSMIHKSEYHFFDKEKMEITVYSFVNNWSPSYHEVKVKPTDGEKYPILKNFFPEHYI